MLVPNKKENIENLQKKLGEVLGLERAAQKAVDELITMKLLKSDSKTEAKEIQGENIELFLSSRARNASRRYSLVLYKTDE